MKIIVNKKNNFANLIQLAQKNKLGILGHSCDIETIVNFQMLLLQQGSNHLQNSIQEISTGLDIPIFFRTIPHIQNIKYIKNLLILGTFPRFEASTLNLHLRKISTKFGTTSNNIGCYNQHNFPVKHSGTSFKTFFSFFSNKHPLVKVLLQKKNLLIITKNSFDFVNTKLNNNFYNQFFIKKFFMNCNSENLYNIISSNVTSNILAELGIFQLPKNLFSLNFMTNKKFNFKEIWGINFDSKNFKTKNSDFILFNTHNITETQFQSENNMYLLPITSHFEKKNSLVNIEGKIQEGKKAVSSLNNQIKSFSDIVESFSIFNDEFFTLFLQNKFFLKENIINYYSTKNNFENFLVFNWQKRLEKNYNKKKANSFKQQFLNNQSLLNFVRFNKNKHLFSFFYLYFLPKELRVKSYIFNFKNIIQNFYFTDLVTKNSNLMSLSTFFNLTNPQTPLKR